MLQEHRWQQLKDRQALGEQFKDSGLVFSTLLSSPIDASNLRRIWNKVDEKTGLDGLRFHDLRHSHATFLIKEGFNPKVVSERLGHADVGITLNTYTHLLAADQAEAAAFMDRLLEIPH
jgi:integrase